jgi:hypothetical protein
MAFRGSTTKKTHVGYVVDRDGTVVEAQGRRAGVCTSNLQSKTGNGSYYWEYFARPDIFRKEIEADTGTTSPTTRQVEVVGASVNVRRVDSSTADIAFIAKRGEKFPFKGTAPSGWHIISTKACEMLFISNRTDLTKIV